MEWAGWVPRGVENTMWPIQGGNFQDCSWPVYLKDKGDDFAFKMLKLLKEMLVRT